MFFVFPAFTPPDISITPPLFWLAILGLLRTSLSSLSNTSISPNDKGLSSGICNIILSISGGDNSKFTVPEFASAAGV